MTFHPPEHRSPRGRVPPAPFGFWSPSLTWAHLCPPGQDQREELLSAESPVTSRGHQLCSLQRSLLKVDTSGHLPGRQRAPVFGVCVHTDSAAMLRPVSPGHLPGLGWWESGSEEVGPRPEQPCS